jgi:two-component system chemotaxis response regulator CheY
LRRRPYGARPWKRVQSKLAAQAHGRRTSMPVLVVDDYKTMIRIIRNLLKQLGFANVDEAGGGSAALDMMRLKQYGPRHLGLEHGADDRLRLLREVRADDRLSRTPFIMVTAESRTDNVSPPRRLA